MKGQKKKKVEERKNLYYGLLILGIIIFCLPFLISIGSFLFGAPDDLKSVMDVFLMISILYKPGYIIGFLMIGLSLSKLYDTKKK